VILASLSLGYWAGGILADRNPSFGRLAWVIFGAGAYIGFIFFLKPVALVFAENNFRDLRLGAFFASVIIFSPPSFLLGMVSPYAVRLKLSDVVHSGRTAGSLYALSTVGSIAGTFLCGFYLIPNVGTDRILMILSGALIVTSLILSYKGFNRSRISALVAVFFIFYLSGQVDKIMRDHGVVDIDTPYNHVSIRDWRENESGDKVRSLIIGRTFNTSIYLDSEKLVHGYTKFYHLAQHFNPDLTTALMIGGGAFSYPMDFIKKYPNARIDVVEIDPKLTEIAKSHFRLRDDRRLSIINEDGRIFLNRTKNRYDVIFGDAFSSNFSLPFHLTTVEAARKKYEILNDEGFAIINIISPIDGSGGRFLSAEYATYRKIFPQVILYAVDDAVDRSRTQNIMLVAFKKQRSIESQSQDPQIAEMLSHEIAEPPPTGIPVLTDDFCPVDHYTVKGW